MEKLVSALLSGRKRASFYVILLYHKSLFLQPAIVHIDAFGQDLIWWHLHDQFCIMKHKIFKTKLVLFNLSAENKFEWHWCWESRNLIIKIYIKLSLKFKEYPALIFVVQYMFFKMAFWNEVVSITRKPVNVLSAPYKIWSKRTIVFCTVAAL